MLQQILKNMCKISKY